MRGKPTSPTPSGENYPHDAGVVGPAVMPQERQGQSPDQPLGRQRHDQDRICCGPNPACQRRMTSAISILETSRHAMPAPRNWSAAMVADMASRGSKTLKMPVNDREHLLVYTVKVREQ